jgi:hypothetical protein
MLVGSGGAAGVSAAELHCVSINDAQALDTQLAAAGSPLAGNGAVFVREGIANNIDPRFIVAITAQETMLETYGPAQDIHNAFGLGPGIAFATEADAITMAAQTLHRYTEDGLTTIGAVSGRWAPVGASNDPQGLNGGWTAGVGAFYAALGGDPLRPILADAQDPSPTCAPAGATAAPGVSQASPAIIPAVTPTDGPAVVTVWGGKPPAQPTAGPARLLDGFVFPLAPPNGSAVQYTDAATAPVFITTAPGVLVVAPIAGRLKIASAADQQAGIGSWIIGASGNRIGIGALAAYEPGIAEGVRVTAGQVIGRSNGSLPVAWRVRGSSVSIFPMLDATRPSD